MVSLAEKFRDLVPAKHNKQIPENRFNDPSRNSQVTLKTIGHAHIDNAWQWSRFEGDAEVLATFSSAADILENDPEAHFSASNGYNYDYIAKNEPELLERIKKLYKKGQWEPIGGMWIEADQNLIGTEAAARNALYGQRTFQEIFGDTVEVGFEPDGFGHRADGPTRLANSGIKYFLFMRPQHNEMPLPVGAFWWSSPDGANKILTQQIPNEYCSTEDGAREHMQAIVDAMSEHMDEQIMFVGYGNHGGGLTVEMLNKIRELSQRPDMPNVIFSSAINFFKGKEKEIQENEKHNKNVLPEPEQPKGLKPNRKPEAEIIYGALEVHATGTYTTESEIKDLLSRSEKRVLQAEKMAALGHIMGMQYPQEDFERLWKLHLDNNMHDISPGDSIQEVNEQAKFELGGIIGEANRIAHRYATRLMRQIDIPKPTDHNPHDERPFVAFNTHFSDDKQVIRKEFIGIDKNDYAVLVDDEGRYIPYQDIQNTMLGGGGKRNIIFLDNLPQMGYRTYHMIKVNRETMLQSYGEDMLRLMDKLPTKDKSNNGDGINGNHNGHKQNADESFGFTRFSLGSNGHSEHSENGNGNENGKTKERFEGLPFIENKRFKLVFDKKTGDIISQFDKREGYDPVYTDPEGNVHSFASVKMYDSREPTRDVPSDAWDHKNSSDNEHPIKAEKALVAEPTPESTEPVQKEIVTGEFTDAKFEMIEQGPVRTVLRVTSRWEDPDKYRNPKKAQDKTLWEDSSLVRYYVLYNDEDIGYYDIEGDFDNNTRHKTAKMNFMMGLEHRRHTRDAGLVSNDRAEDNRILPTLSWVYASGKQRSESKETYGVGVMCDTKHGYTVKERDVQITLSSTPIVSHHTPDVEKQGEYYEFIDQGKQKFRMRVTAGAGHVQHSEVARMAQEFNEKPIVVAATFNKEGILPGNGSFLQVDTDSKAVMTTLKKAEDSDKLVLRGHNPYNEYAKMHYKLPVLQREFDVTLDPYETITMVAGEDGPIETTDFPELNIGQGAGYLINSN